MQTKDRKRVKQEHSEDCTMVNVTLFGEAFKRVVKFQSDWDAKTGKSYWDTKPNAYIVNQFRLRGFENRSEWRAIQKLTKAGLVKMVMELVGEENW